MNQTIALVTGGFTGESVISLKSADVIARNLDNEKFNVYKIIITRLSWYYEDVKGERFEVDKNDFSLEINNEKVYFDGIFIGLHGSPGEDGKLQGYFDMLGIPYTSCDAITSSLTMNKAYTKAIVSDIQNLFIARSVQLFSTQSGNQEKVNKLQLPYFVKPNNGGSSIGMSKVNDGLDLAEALEKAFKEDDEILVEEFINGREFTIGVYKGRDGVKVLPATEIISSNEFFDFEAKYTPGVSQEITPGRMTDEERDRVDEIVKEVYILLNCRGVVRIDYFLEQGSGNFYFVEINTVPGQTENSIIPQQVRAIGRTIKDFYTELIEVGIG